MFSEIRNYSPIINITVGLTREKKNQSGMIRGIDNEF